MSNQIADDDDYTLIFGVGSELGGTSLWIGFFTVAAYLLLFSGVLNMLENMTVGTSYQFMLKRMYREIMMVGLGSFIFTILNQTSAELPFGLSQALGFADICCFAMSTFFCLQGVFIMLASVKQAQNWNVASQIPAEELLHNMSVWELSHPLAWQARYLPFCSSREQVEFRVLKSIFAIAYNIKASHSEFDFSIFLRMTHEKNILSIIEISYKNWFCILVLTAFASLKLNYWQSKCSSESCVIEEDVKLFAICGAVYGCLSIALWIWGRVLELRLISSAGVDHVDDYSVFLMTEFKTEENLADCAASPMLAKDVITNFLKEKENQEVETKEEQYVRRHTYMKRVAEEMQQANIGERIKRLTINGSDRTQTSAKYELNLSRLDSAGSQEQNVDNNDDLEQEENYQDVPCVDVNKRSDDENDSSSHFFERTNSFEGPSKNVIAPAPEGTGRTLALSQSNIGNESWEDKSEVQSMREEKDLLEREYGPSNKGRKKPSNRTNLIITKSSTVACEETYEVETDKEESTKTSVKNKIKLKKLPSLNKLVDAGMPMIVRRNRNRMRKSSLDGLAKNGKRVFKKQASLGWKISIDKLFTRSKSTAADLSAQEREVKFKSIVTSNFGKQNFKNLFLFKNPNLFYSLISFVITCNSLYLAWWATNFLFVILKLDGSMRQLVLMLVSLIPPIVTFPTIFLVIRSSTIMKAITFLDLEVVAKVIEQSQVNTAMLAEFRTTILAFMKKQGPGVEGMIKTCNEFAENGSNMLTKSEFRQMLLFNRVIYTPEKINFLFGSIDLNGGSTVDYGEFETFLFAGNNIENDRKRQELFQKMSIHKVKDKGRGNNAAVRILSKLAFESFRKEHLEES